MGQLFSVSYLKLCMFMNVFGPLSTQDELGFISHPNQVVLHGVTQQPGRKTDAIMRTCMQTIVFYETYVDIISPYLHTK